MHHILYEEDKQLKIASVVTKNDQSIHADTLGGKRVKIKHSQVWFIAENMDTSSVQEDIETLKKDLDVHLLWSCCVPQQEIHLKELGELYYGHAGNDIQLIAIAYLVHASPIYFQRKGKGIFIAVEEQVVQKALTTQAKRAEEHIQIMSWVDQLCSGSYPEHFQNPLIYCTNPNKQLLEYKALELAASRKVTSILGILHECGVLPSYPDRMMAQFTQEHFPEGLGFSKDLTLQQNNNMWDSLPLAPSEAFSIDDQYTTEIDDAFSLVRHHGDQSGYRLGIHIAVPGLGIEPGSLLEKNIRKRLSTVYYPGGKITMLPDEVVQLFSLNQGCIRPVLSLYMEVDEQLQFKSHETRLERIYISDNLRIETLEPYFNERTVLDFSGDYPYKSELLWLWQLSNILEVRRGKEDSMRSIQLDHSIRIDSMQKVQILTRKRGSPIDKLVAELMILANQHWGKFLAEHATPCIYRVQNESKVKMSLIPDIHQGLGVEFYAWFTSPLRRAIDFYNQSQLLSLIHHNPREKYPKDDLQIIYQAFDFSYQAYLAFQDQLEIYWSYVWLIQEAKKECMAQIIKDEWVRFEEIPIKRKIIGLKQTIPGQKVNIKILDIDLIEPRLECTS